MNYGDLVKRKIPDSDYAPSPKYFGDAYYSAIGIVTSQAPMFPFYNEYCSVTFPSTGVTTKIRCNRLELLSEKV